MVLKTYSMSKYLACSLVILLFPFVLCSCVDKEEKNSGVEVAYADSQQEDYVPPCPHYTPSKELRERRDSIVRELNKKIKVQPVRASHKATTAKMAYEEGFDVGREDGEEDGMNNDPEFSYDDSCPYKGKMRIAYKRGYRNGYDEGLEDGLEEYNLIREPWEEDTDW